MDLSPTGRKMQTSPVCKPQSIAVIGAGISGLSAAWLLSGKHTVTLFESETRLGGHANTRRISMGGLPITVDTGFIVYNEPNYPNLAALFSCLDVETRPSQMSFAVSLDDGRMEYSSNDLRSFSGNGRNLFSRRFWLMIRDIIRFYRQAERQTEWLKDAEHLTLGDYLDQCGYSHAFQFDHLLPQAAAIWSSSVSDMRDYPACAFIRFFENHGLLKLFDRPRWRTVNGGSQAYVAALRAATKAEVLTDSPIRSVHPVPNGVKITDQSGVERHFDKVLIAAHSDQALAMLHNPDAAQRRILSSIPYRSNRAILHTDAALMPRRQRSWASWNYVGHGAGSGGCAVTYWMNRLHGFETPKPLFVTLNPHRAPDPAHVLWESTYDHPAFTPSAMAAQREVWQLQGRGNIWFAGAWLGAGFHEDGIQSGLAAAEHMGGVRRPWIVPNESDRLHFPDLLPPARPGQLAQVA